jgi:hypothetical protein
MGGWRKERYNKDENNKLKGLNQNPDQMEETHWEGQTFSEVVAPQEKKEDEDEEQKGEMWLPCRRFFRASSSVVRQIPG